MEEKKKRRGYKTIEQQMKATKRYMENNPEAKEKRKRSNYKTNGKAFILRYATLEDIKEFRLLLEQREKELEEKS